LNFLRNRLNLTFYELINNTITKAERHEKTW
jgi:hypothetical protein